MYAVSAQHLLALGRMRARQSVEFTNVDLIDGREIATPVEKAAVGLHIMRVEHELMCAV
jgi:hypothetical protein